MTDFALADVIIASNLILEIYDWDAAAGGCHIVIDDENIDDESIDFCVNFISDNENGYPQQAVDLQTKFIKHFKSMSERDREYALLLARGGVPIGELGIYSASDDPMVPLALEFFGDTELWREAYTIPARHRKVWRYVRNIGKETIYRHCFAGAGESSQVELRDGEVGNHRGLVSNLGTVVGVAQADAKPGQYFWMQTQGECKVLAKRGDE